MSVIWKKLWADLWQHKGRTILATLSIAVGILALGFILGLEDQLGPTWNQVHRSIVPPHIYMGLTRPVDRDTVQSLRRVAGVAGIEPMNQRAIRYRRSVDEPWRNGVLMMRDDYERQRYDLLQLKAGAWPRGQSVGIDFRSAASLRLALGDQVIFELDGTDRALPISGAIRYHFIAAPEFGFDTHFFVDGQGLERFGGRAGEFQYLLIRVAPYSEAHAREVASAIKDKLSNIGVSVGLIFYNDPDEHWAQQFVDGLYVIMQLLAVMALGMSVVLIYNTLTALITQQTNQIGIMKAIGGRTGHIIRLYLAGVLVYGALALLIALPIGAVLAFLMAAYFLDIFNIAYETFQVSPRALAVQALAALVVPLLAALGPVLGGARITVRQAIASYGLGSGGAGRLDQAVEQLGSRWLAAPPALALGNMLRRKRRLLLTQVVLVTAGALYLIVMTLSSSINLTIDTELARRGYQIQLSFTKSYRLSRLEQMAAALPGVAEAEAWFGHPANLLRPGRSTHEAGAGAVLVGLPPDSTLYRPRIVNGRWLLPADDRAIVLSEETANKNDIRVGDSITLDLGDLGDESWRVVGLYRVLAIRPAPEHIYAPRAAVFRATSRSNAGNMLVVRASAASDAAAVTELARQLGGLFEGQNWSIAETATIVKDRQFFDSFFAQYIPMLLALAAVTALVGGIGLMGALSIAVVERTREIGVMRAIGARSPHLMLMLILEGVAQGLLSWAVAVPLSFVLGRQVANLMGQAIFDVNLDYQYHAWAMLFWLGAVMLIAVLASVLPARSATRISVRASLAYA